MFDLSGDWLAGENLMTSITLAGIHWSLLRNRQILSKVSIGAVMLTKNSVFCDSAKGISHIRPSLPAKGNLFALCNMNHKLRKHLGLVRANGAVQVTWWTACDNGLFLLSKKSFPREQNSKLQPLQSAYSSLYAYALFLSCSTLLPPPQMINSK